METGIGVPSKNESIRSSGPGSKYRATDGPTNRMSAAMVYASADRPRFSGPPRRAPGPFCPDSGPDPETFPARTRKSRVLESTAAHPTIQRSRPLSVNPPDVGSRRLSGKAASHAEADVATFFGRTHRHGIGRLNRQGAMSEGAPF